MTVTCRPGKKNFLVQSWNKKILDYEEKPLLEFWSHCDDPLVVEPGFTLWDFFICLSNSFLDCHGITQLCQYSSCDVVALLEDVTKNPPTWSVSAMKYLEVYPYLDLGDYEEAGTPQLSLSWGFHGWGPLQNEDGAVEDCSYAVELTPLPRLRNLELRLNKKTELGLQGPAPDYKWKHLLAVQLEPTFLEFCRAILWELGFFGSPSSRDAFAAELMQTSADFKAGKLKTISLDELKLKIDDILVKPSEN